MSAVLLQLLLPTLCCAGVLAHLLRPLSVLQALSWGAVLGFLLVCALGSIGWAPLGKVMLAPMAIAGVALLFAVPRGPHTTRVDRGRWTAALIVGACVLVLGLAFAEASLRPLYAWDAWSAWWVDAELDRARAEGARVGLTSWLLSDNAHFHPIAHYPPLLRAYPSVLALSSPMPMGPLAALGWLWIALGCLVMLYVQLGRAGVGQRGAALAALTLATTPLWLNHLVLPGQMDLPLSWLWLALLLATVEAHSDRRYRVLAAVLALALLLCKLEALIYLAALGLALAPARLRRGAGVLLAVALIAGLWVLPAPPAEPLQLAIAGVDLRIEASWVLPALFGDLVGGSFGLLPPLVLVSLAQLWTATGRKAELALLIRTLVYALLGLVALFSLTSAADYVESGTVFNRLMLHSLPAWVYVLAVAHLSSSSAPASQPDKAGDASSPGAPSA